MSDFTELNGGEQSRERDFKPAPQSDAARSAMEWRDATLEERGRALKDLLLLVDALPSRKWRRQPLRFPRLDSAKFS
jgi:hypothetical protein